MNIPTLRLTRSQFLQKVARFSNLEEVHTGLPDMEIDGFRRSFLLVLGSEQPADKDRHAPSGSQAKPAILDESAPVNMGYVRARVGNGVMMHNHDTSETFVVLEGRWRIKIQGESAEESADLQRYDVVTIPPGVHRAFECLETDAGQETGLLLAMVAKQTPEGAPAAVEFSPESIRAIQHHEQTLRQAVAAQSPSA